MMPRVTEYSSAPVCLSFSREEAFEMLDKQGLCYKTGQIEIILAKDLKDVLYDLTRGHCYALSALLAAVIAESKLRRSFTSSTTPITLAEAFEWFRNPTGLFQRLNLTGSMQGGAPHKYELTDNPALAQALLRAVTETYVYPEASQIPVFELACNKNFLHFELDSHSGAKYYQFAFEVHRINAERLFASLDACPPSIPSAYYNPAHLIFVTLTTLSTSSLTRLAQHDPKSHYFLEFYRAIYQLIGHQVLESPWTGLTPVNGIVELFIPDRKWVLALTTDFAGVGIYSKRYNSTWSWTRQEELNGWGLVNFTTQAEVEKMQAEGLDGRAKWGCHRVLHVVVEEGFERCTVLPRTLYHFDQLAPVGCLGTTDGVLVLKK
ncbi:hypothetical protein BJ508DRAFT_367584 [Ascobolus immersus RN42]|uniref:Uncharacterized protein n=1 Tax=Ascobolus immersus RN42 TaxID=1160509 RepID=A0A3N4HBJ0_ASCIM|nr:hypothetical protein BJ508DRAFT_367584 [Ascobolus immersus RN42]